MAKNIKRPIRFVARKNTDPVGTVTEWGAWRKGKKGIAKKTFPGTHAKKKTLTNKSTNTSPRRKLTQVCTWFLAQCAIIMVYW